MADRRSLCRWCPETETRDARLLGGPGIATGGWFCRSFSSCRSCSHWSLLGVVTYGTANLRYARVTEQRSDQLAAADAAMSYAVNLLKIGAADCIFNDQTIDLPTLAESFNGATGAVKCSQTGGGLDNAGMFAMG